MKAKLVNESIEFQRGADPKTSLGLGYGQYMLKNFTFNQKEREIKKLMTEDTGLSEEEIYLLGDSRYPYISEYYDRLTDAIYGGEKYSEHEIPEEFADDDEWIGSLEIYHTEKGQMITFETSHYSLFFGDINTFNAFNTKEHLKNII
jgi:hypothetical protein